MYMYNIIDIIYYVQYTCINWCAIFADLMRNCVTDLVQNCVVELIHSLIT